MKSAIVYYSSSGNTKKVADFLAEHLRQKGEVEIIPLQAEESDNFFLQAAKAFSHQKTEVKAVNFNLKDFDLLCFGTPVWAFAPAPAMNFYLERCFGLETKKIILFCTYGSGVGKDRCLDYMQKILASKGAKEFRRFAICGKEASNKDFVLKEILSLF